MLGLRAQDGSRGGRLCLVGVVVAGRWSVRLQQVLGGRLGEGVGAVREAVGRGVVMRRARIVSEPVTDYIRWEHAATSLNVDAGELVRWLPRRRAVDIALPGADFWLFDDRLVQFNIFTGDGDWADPPKEFSEDPAVVKLCSDAFEAVWERAVDHEKYTV